MNFFLLSQGVGLIALGIQIVGFIEKRDKKFFLFLSLSSFFWAIHYFMMGLLSGSIVNVIDVIKNFFGYKQIKWKWLFWVLLFLYLVIGVFLFDGTFVGILPIVASLLSIYAIFYSKGENLRLYYTLIMSIWLLYNILVFSIPGTVTNMLLLGELVYTYYCIHAQKKKYKQKVQNILTKQ